GVASQRKAIANGIAEQYAKLKEVGIDKTAEQLLMMTQYFDTMQNVAQEGRSNVLFMPSNPGGQGEMGQEIRNALFAANAAELGRIRSAERAVTEVESKVDRPAVDELTAASAGPTAMIHR